MADARFERLLIVCTGNICRSPMAECMLTRRLDGVAVASAGIGALVDHPADAHAVSVMTELGFDLTGHCGRQFDLELAGGFELILVMEPHQQKWIEQRFPELRGRVRRLGHWLDMDIPDPYRQSVEEFRRVRDMIAQAVDSWMEHLA